MPEKIRWLVTLEGVPMAFPSASSIVEGEEVAVSEAEAELAISEGLAEPVTEEGEE